MKLALLAGVVLVAVAVAWFAAEQHYDNCVQAAQARTPLSPTAEEQARLNRLEFDAAAGEDVRAERVKLEGAARARREAAVEGCSRLP